MMRLRIQLFPDQRAALLQSRDDVGNRFTLAALIGCLRHGDPLAREWLARATEHLPAGHALFHPSGERLGLLFELSQAGDLAARQRGAGAGNGGVAKQKSATSL